MASAAEPTYQRLTIYIGESDTWHGRPLWQALLEHLAREGFAGATVLRGMAGFGAHSRIKTASILNLSADLPLIVVVVDREDRLAAGLPTITAMVGEGLVTLEPMSVVKYTHREAPHLPADSRVRDLMTAEVVAVHPDDPLKRVAELLLNSHFTAVPVIDEQRRVLGIISDGDFVEWPELALRFRTPERLAGTTLAELLAEVETGRARAAEIMTRQVVTVREDQSSAEAANLMVQRDLKTLPVVDGDGRLVGALSRIDVLRGMVREAPAAVRGGLPAADLYVLRDVMRCDVPTVSPDAALHEVVQQVLGSDLNRAFVVDGDHRPIGVITDGDLVARVQGPLRTGVVRALWRRVSLARPEAAASRQVAKDLMSSPVLTARDDTPISEAIRILVQEKRRRLAVVDSRGRLIGAADRRGLLRAFLGGSIHGWTAPESGKGD